MIKPIYYLNNKGTKFIGVLKAINSENAEIYQLDFDDEANPNEAQFFHIRGLVLLGTVVTIPTVNILPDLCIVVLYDDILLGNILVKPGMNVWWIKNEFEILTRNKVLLSSEFRKAFTSPYFAKPTAALGHMLRNSKNTFSQSMLQRVPNMYYFFWG